MAVPVSSADMNPTLAKKLRKVLEMRLDTPELTGSLMDLSSFYGENSPEHRRGLRAQLERRGVEVHKKMLEAFRPVAEAVQELDRSVDDVIGKCDGVTERLREVKEKNAALIEASETIQSKRESVASKREMVGSFFEQIFLRPDEAAALTQGPENEAFFSALQHLQSIQRDNQVLLQIANQRAGIEIMDKMSTQLEQAFEVLYRWIIDRFQEMQGKGYDSYMDNALVALRSRPALLDICLDEYVMARKSVLLRQFLAALTTGGSGGMPRPIDMLAHEPTRFVGDMLAWVHEALAVERDLVQTLFQASPAGSAGQSQHSVSSVVGAILVELSGPIKGRLKQVLASNSSVILCFQVSNILEFYVHAISSKCVASTEMHPSMLELSELCRAGFMNALQSHLDRLLRSPPPPNSDLTPAHSVAEVIAWTEQMAGLCASSIVPEEHRCSSFAKILDSILEPLLRACVLSSQARNSTDAAIFMLNTTCMLLSALAGHDFAAAASRDLESRLEGFVSTVVDDQAVAGWH
eukprot:TRINITY_DN8025_c0_g1_i4.p1 TRINITY_DN8025_c0_g1~~TRINITY_DN8025_c0_g1_i4.p1  ORF type:complete len:522 (+),score=134.85 TRINITY_DN8025_c0_g1_i4:174-1739(+)